MSGLVTVIKGALEELEGAEALLEEMAEQADERQAMGLLAISARLTSGRARLETLVEMLRSPGPVRYNGDVEEAKRLLEIAPVGRVMQVMADDPESLLRLG